MAIFQPPPDVIDHIVQAVAASPHYQTQGTTIVNTSTSSVVATIDFNQERRFVKCGANVSISEALAMEYVRSVTSIPVPKVYAVFTRSNWTYIVMEYIEAETLDDAQFSMTPEQLSSVARKLKDITLQLKNLSSGPSHNSATYGAWPEGPYCNIYYQSKLPAKPFLNMVEFYLYWIGRLNAEDVEELSMDAQAFSDSAPTLTHGDLSPRNILVKEGTIVAVLDWETFGWYPEFWEYMAAYRGAWHRGWLTSLESAFGKLSTTGGRFLSIVHSALVCQRI